MPDANGDRRSSAIKQVASGRFGVTSEYLVSAQELQIKMAQGAKPGEGGQLPGHKVDREIARIRHSTAGVGLISPPPHHDIYSIEDLAQLIHDLKNSNRQARISVKLVAEVGVGTVAAGVAKGKADVVLISGHEGGTGASPLTSIKHAGTPWELGLAETHQVLVLNDLRSRIVVQTDGQLAHGRGHRHRHAAGGRGMGHRHGRAGDDRLHHDAQVPSEHLPGRRRHARSRAAQEVRRQAGARRQLLLHVAEELREIMARLGFRTINEMVGRVDRLETRHAIAHWKARGSISTQDPASSPDVPADVKTYCAEPQDHGIDQSLDMTHAAGALQAGDGARQEPVSCRACGSRTSTARSARSCPAKITRRHGAAGLPEDTIELNFRGTAGQSLMAFGVHGVTVRVEGDVNDYCGKGLSGGKSDRLPPIAKAPSGRGKHHRRQRGACTARPAARYTCAASPANGSASAKRCSRPSWKGVGDHGCEYMTGGGPWC